MTAHHPLPSAIQTWSSVAAVAEHSGDLRRVFDSSKSSAALVAGFLRGCSEIPDWLVEAAASTPDPTVASAALERAEDIGPDRLTALLSVRNEKLASTFAASELAGSLDADLLELFVYSNSQKVRSALAANTEVPQKFRTEALLGRKRDGEPIAQLINLDLDGVTRFIAASDPVRAETLASSAFPEVLWYLLSKTPDVPADPAQIVCSALDGLELCMQRRSRGAKTQRKIAGEYMRVLFQVGVMSHLSPSARAEFVDDVQLLRQSVSYDEMGKKVSVVRDAPTWEGLDSADFDRLRTLAAALSASKPLVETLGASNRDLREFHAALESKTVVPASETSEVFDRLAVMLSEGLNVDGASRAVRALVTRTSPEDLAEVLPRVSELFPDVRVSLSNADQLAEFVSVELAAEHLVLHQLLRWPTADVAAWLSGRGLDLAELLRLDSELNRSCTASELAAVLGSE